jgi:uncharacterized protein YqeY
MVTKAQLTSALKEAMRSGDKTKKTTLRMTLAAIKNAEIQRGGELNEEDIQGIILKEVKSRNEAIDEARLAQRSDLEMASMEEVAILEAFLPKPLTVEELQVLVKEAIDETGATSLREMGKVMSNVMPRVRGRADGKTISSLVRKHLQD